MGLLLICRLHALTETVACNRFGDLGNVTDHDSSHDTLCSSLCNRSESIYRAGCSSDAPPRAPPGSRVYTVNTRDNITTRSTCVVLAGKASHPTVKSFRWSLRGCMQSKIDVFARKPSHATVKTKLAMPATGNETYMDFNVHTLTDGILRNMQSSSTRDSRCVGRFRWTTILSSNADRTTRPMTSLFRRRQPRPHPLGRVFA